MDSPSFIPVCLHVCARPHLQGQSLKRCCQSAYFNPAQFSFGLWFWQQEAEAALRKARALKTQRREEYEKAQSSTHRSLEEQSNSMNKQLEKKRKLEEEALQKVNDTE